MTLGVQGMTRNYWAAGSGRRNFRLTRRLRALLATLPLMFFASGAWAQDAGLRLEAVDVSAQAGGRVVVYLTLSGPAPEPLSFAIDNPARISIDLPDTGLALASRRSVFKEGPLDTVVAAEAQGRTRVVLNMDYMVPYQTRVDGNVIVVSLGEGSAGPAAAPTFASAEPAAAAPASGRAVSDVDFRRTEDGGGRVIITLTDPSTEVDMREEGANTVLDFRKTDLPQNLRRRLDVLDFATPVTTVDSVRAGDGTRVIVAATGNYETYAYQADNIFTLEVRPVVEVPQDALGIYDEGKEYTGQRLTLNFQDIETRAVLQLLAEVSGLNMVVSDTVTGNVTLRLRNVPWDQALDIVMATRGLDSRQIDNVIMVGPADEIAARERADLAARQELQQLTPLRSDYIQVNYAKATELATLIQGGGENSLLSERGSVSIDERTNTLLVYDTADRLEDIRELVQILDIPVKQVLIESRIVIVNDDFSRDLGVRMGVTYVDDNGDGLISVTGSGTGSDTIVQSGIENINTTGTPFPVDVPPISERYNVNLPIDNPAGRIALAILDSDYLLDLELQAAQSEGRGEVISTPRVITANQKEALIKQGVEIPYQESSSSGATTTQFKEAVLSLLVTPQITPDDRIIMDLEVNQDNVGQYVPSATGGLVPSIDTRSVTTQVLVNDGETVVLGGIFETERRETINKVPILGDIPGVGRLFKSNSDTSNKRELLIFVTPKILREGSNIY
jgi:type IV pilus assembly protein PilQ